MVVIFPTGVEWCLTLSPWATISTCLFGCIRFLWLWSSGSRWCMVHCIYNHEWPSCWSVKEIAVKELTCMPNVLAVVLWGPHWAGKHVLFHTDNLAMVQVVQALNAADPLLCSLLRCLYFYSAHYQFTFTAEHIPGVKNVAADALSRNNLPLFRSLFLQVPRHTIPHRLVELFLLQMPDWNSGAWMTQFRSSLLPASPPLQ